MYTPVAAKHVNMQCLTLRIVFIGRAHLIDTIGDGQGVKGNNYILRCVLSTNLTNRHRRRKGLSMQLVEILLVGVGEMFQDLFLPGQISSRTGGPLAVASSITLSMPHLLSRGQNEAFLVQLLQHLGNVLRLKLTRGIFQDGLEFLHPLGSDGLWVANDGPTVWGDADLMGLSECRRHFAQGGVDDRPGAGVPRDGGGRAAVAQRVSR